MIYTIEGFLFMFNLPLPDGVISKIRLQIATLDRLLITPFELVMLPEHPNSVAMTLYEDPVIRLLSPLSIASEHLQKAGFSRGIVEATAFDYDIEKSIFSINKTINELVGMFQGDNTLLFVEIPD